MMVTIDGNDRTSGVPCVGVMVQSSGRLGRREWRFYTG